MDLWTPAGIEIAVLRAERVLEDIQVGFRCLFIRFETDVASRFSGEPVNLRDQHDAVEFLNTVVDSVDEALKSLNLPQICSKVLGGTFADQKICKDCPHRYGSPLLSLSGSLQPVDL